MTVRRSTQKALAILLPTGLLGVSSALAAHADKFPAASAAVVDKPLGVAERLSEIRSGISEINALAAKNPNLDSGILLAEWVNFGGGVGWRNGGWGNGGWHNAPNWRNGGWGNGGWHNAPNWGNGGWGNGGWHNAPNWGNGGWHNWHNFWHNW